MSFLSWINFLDIKYFKTQNTAKYYKIAKCI